MRLLLAGLLLPAMAAVQMPPSYAAPATALCPRYNPSFYVELGAYGADVGATAYTGGAPLSRGGQIQYAWASNSSGKIDRACTLRRGNVSGSPAGLRAPVRVRSGQYYYERFECNVRGRLLIRVEKAKNGHTLRIKLEGGRRLLVLATVTSKDGTLRTARACLRNPP